MPDPQEPITITTLDPPFYGVMIFGWRFTPLPDMTVSELAEIMMLCFVLNSWTPGGDESWFTKGLSDRAKRHFTSIET